MTLQLPIDHFIVLVSDLQGARDAFVEAGFNATSLARHSEAMGTANSCIMLHGAYIELMGMVAETPANEGWRSLLAGGPGLKGLALASADIGRTAIMLAAKNITTDPPRHFSRVMPEGELRFSIIRLPPALTPGLQCIYCQHHTRDLLWTQEAMTHANGATRVLSATVPGASSLARLEGQEGPSLRVVDGAEGAIAIAMTGAIPAGRLAEIERLTGLHIEAKTAA